MKIASIRRGGLYVRCLLVFACFFGSLLIDPAVLAQKKVPGHSGETFTRTEAPDNRYGEGGTRATSLDEQDRVRTIAWMDKDGKVRELYNFYPDYPPEHPKEGNWRETWLFYTADQYEAIRALSYSGNEKFDVGDFSLNASDHPDQHLADMRRNEALSLIEKVEKQFAKNGTIPNRRDLLKKEVDSKLAQEKPKEVDTQVEQPDLDKQRRVFVGAEEAKAAAQKRAEVKAQCDGIREKIRTLQDSLRKRQEEPASPKQDLETIRKQIDDLLNRLADCPKQEPIDAQFDCLKAKFPEVRHLVTSPILAVDPASGREFAWDEDKQAWIDDATKESICPPSGIDQCLVGTWECTSFKEANKFITGGGTGFRVTFKSDGTETVDYSKMQPIRAGGDKMVYEGKATARISAKDGVAKIEKMIEAGVTFDAAFMVKRYGKEWNPKLPELGPGGLGTTKGKNNYKCTGDSLEYQSSTPRGAADCTVKLTKVKPEGEKK